MKKARFTTEQIIAILQEHAAGVARAMPIASGCSRTRTRG
jgi:hypothetical protein